jgi:hypothetical protein
VRPSGGSFRLQILRLSRHSTAMKKAQRIDDLEAVLRRLFASHDARAIEMPDEIRLNESI